MNILAMVSIDYCFSSDEEAAARQKPAQVAWRWGPAAVHPALQHPAWPPHGLLQCACAAFLPQHQRGPHPSRSQSCHHHLETDGLLISWAAHAVLSAGPHAEPAHEALSAFATSRCACHWLPAALKGIAGVFLSMIGASPANYHTCAWYICVLLPLLVHVAPRSCSQGDEGQVCTHLHCFGCLLDDSVHARDRLGTSIDDSLANALVLSSSINLQMISCRSHAYDCSAQI